MLTFQKFAGWLKFKKSVKRRRNINQLDEEEVVVVETVTVCLSAGTYDTYHKSCTGALSWRTCHDKLRSRGVFDQFNV